MANAAPIAFVDLKAQYAAYRLEIDAAMARVMEHSKFIMGPEVAELEEALARFAGASYSVACSSGTDAILMIMMAEGIGPGDAVFVPSFTFTATAEVPLLLGATPVFVDVDPEDFNIDCADLEAKIAAVKAAGTLRPRGILAVDLFGLPADYASLNNIGEAHGLTVWADAAQSFGARSEAGKVGALARATAVSFFPAKPLGCYGDGGAVLTDDAELAAVMRSLRAHGKGGAKYDIERVGLNARLDTIQAAVLLAKLPYFQGELDRREEVAARYDAALADAVATPVRRPGRQSAWAQYTLRLTSDRRDTVAEALKAQGVPTAVYYPRPMHLQTAYSSLGAGPGDLPVSEELSKSVLSLPMQPFLTDAEVDRITAALLGVLG